MNSLSWMIYLADVAESVSITLGMITAVSIAGGLICLIVYGVSHDKDMAKSPLTGVRTIAFWLLGAALAALLINAPIPSAETVYAIAASEMGEQVISSPTAGKAIKALDAWLDRQIAGEPEKK